MIRIRDIDHLVLRVVDVDAMLIEPRESGIPIFDTARLHAEAAALLALDDAPLVGARATPRVPLAEHG